VVCTGRLDFQSFDPGGGIEDRETREEAAIRECKEEAAVLQDIHSFVKKGLERSS